MVKIVSLMTGEDVIGSVEEKNNGYEITNPLLLILSQQGIGTMPLVPYSLDKTFFIKDQHVLFVSNPEPELANQYKAQFGGGIITPDLKIVK